MLLRSICIFATVFALFAQAPRHESQPVYRVNIVQRTTPALNYGHLSEPTKIDFRGTALLPESHGEATIDAKRGAVLIRAHFDQVPPPTRFGPNYLTYVVWAISPEGRAQNLGELVLDGSQKGSLTASSAMQAFALIVTAEPYFSVAQPSDVVVMENRVRPDTVGKVEEVNATYELLPRKGYTYSMTSRPGDVPAGGRPVSMPEYEAITARYQAQNAIQTALVAGAEQYAPERINRAQQLLIEAQRLSAKEFSKDVVAEAREAAQIAEDARVIAVRRAEEDRVARERAQNVERERQAELNRAGAGIAAERAQLQADRARLEAERAEAAAAAAVPARAPQQTASADRMRTPPPADAVTRANRARLTQYLRSYFETLDTPRGVVVIIPDAMLESGAGAERVRMRLASLRSALTAYGSLNFDVGGYTDAPNGFGVSEARAERVREMLIAMGIPAATVTARSYGAAHPLDSNATVAGRQENRRIEIVITGPAIGDMPTWDHAYSIRP